MICYSPIIRVIKDKIVPSSNSSPANKNTQNSLQLDSLSLKMAHVDIYLVRPQMLDKEVHGFFKTITSTKEQEKINKKRTDKGKQDALITRGLIRCVLSRYASVAPIDWTFDTGWNGKPSVSDECLPTANDIEFNLSHANGLIACAITKSQPLGIDVEYTERNSDTYKLAPRYFSESENRDLQTKPYNEQPLEFYKYWTLKESYIKACGGGLSIPLNHFSFDITKPDDIKLSFDAARNDTPAHWKSFLFDVTEDHKMALTLKIEALKIETVKAEQPCITTTIYVMNNNGEFEIASLPLT